MMIPLGYSYPDVLDHRPIQWLWRILFCRMGWHLWDEVVSLYEHCLSCDACGVAVRIAGPEGEVVSGQA